MIAGLGVALVESDRVERLLDRHGPRLAERLFTPSELRAGAGRRGAERLAARLAAKLAARDALGRSPGLRLRDFEVVGGGRERPFLRLHGTAARRARQMRIEALHLSLTHDPPCAIGQVVAEGA